MIKTMTKAEFAAKYNRTGLGTLPYASHAKRNGKIIPNIVICPLCSQEVTLVGFTDMETYSLKEYQLHIYRTHISDSTEEDINNISKK